MTALSPPPKRRANDGLEDCSVAKYNGAAPDGEVSRACNRT
jgi:hypothetical protein